MAAKHSVVILHGPRGQVRSEVTGTHSLNTWTNKKQNGVTVRTDHSATFRFENAVLEDAYTLDTLF